MQLSLLSDVKLSLLVLSLQAVGDPQHVLEPVHQAGADSPLGHLVDMWLK